MNLFPRKVKERAAHPRNRLEVLDEGIQANSKQGTQRGHDTTISVLSGGKQQPLGGSISVSSNRPRRQVILSTVRKEQPLKRYNRDLSRSRQGQERREREKRSKEEQDPVDECAHTTHGFNTLLRNSVKKPKEERRQMAIKVLTKMRSVSVPLDKDTFNWLLQLLMDSNETDCFQIYRQMKEDAALNRDDSNLRPDIQTYRSLIRACERSGSFEKAFQLFNEMKEMYDIEPDVIMYNTLMGFCVLRRDENQASQLFEEMKERKIQPTVHTYNCLMNVFAEGPTELLSQMFEDMLKQRIAPNLRTYNTLMRACQRANDYDKAFKLFEELKLEGLRPDVVTYNILIDMCRERLDYVQGKKQQVMNRRSKEQQESGMKAIAVLSLSLFNEMDEKEIRPNTFTYNALMGVLARCADLRVFTVFRAMKEDAKEEEEDRARLQELLDSGDLQDSEGALMLAGLGDVQNGVLMDAKSGATLRGHYQRLLIGDDYLARQSAFGVNPDIVTYQTLIVAAERMRKADNAYEVFEEMKQSGLRPDSKTYVIMMDVCCINNETERALELFREATQNKIILDAELYNAFINVLAEAGDGLIFEAFAEIANNKRLNIKPNQKTYNTLIKACPKLTRPGDQIFNDENLPTTEEDMRERDRLIAERNAERSEKAFSIYRQMCQKTAPVKPDVETYNTLMDVCHMNQDIIKARDLIEDMKTREIKPTITTYNKMMAVFVAASDSSVTDIFNVLRTNNDPSPNLESYTILLECYADRNDSAILQLFDDMKKVGIDPDSRVYNIMLMYCSKLQDKRKSLKFFEELKVRELTADIHTYNALMAVFAESGDDLIFKVFEEMIENCITPDKTTYSTLIKQKRGLDCLRRAGEKGLLDPNRVEKEIES